MGSWGKNSKDMIFISILVLFPIEGITSHRIFKMTHRVPRRQRVINVIEKNKRICVLIFVHFQSAYFTVSVSCVIDLLQFIMIVGNKGGNKEKGPKNDT
jgi:hypothetical protein